MAEEYPRLGTLEHQVMDVLWDCPDELCARRVLERLATTSLAYTTVATVLTNLTRKGMLERTSTLRSWAYRPTMSRSEYVAGCMVQSLRGAEDRSAALQELVGRLGDGEREALRRALEGRPTPR
ncbi:BlaI/MecI/CopY family transcriptional regulator [Actinotalea sp. AC32]|nr:BlaI/MecI/CopY family transcriptional regulator [Actinotalea sp. AC32]